MQEYFSKIASKTLLYFKLLPILIFKYSLKLHKLALVAILNKNSNHFHTFWILIICQQTLEIIENQIIKFNLRKHLFSILHQII